MTKDVSKIEKQMESTEVDNTMDTTDVTEQTVDTNLPLVQDDKNENWFAKNRPLFIKAGKVAVGAIAVGAIIFGVRLVFKTDEPEIVEDNRDEIIDADFEITEE